MVRFRHRQERSYFGDTVVNIMKREAETPPDQRRLFVFPDGAGEVGAEGGDEGGGAEDGLLGDGEAQKKDQQRSGETCQGEEEEGRGAGVGLGGGHHHSREEGSSQPEDAAWDAPRVTRSRLAP